MKIQQFIPTLLATLLVVASVGGARAQDFKGERVQMELDITDRRIAGAKALVSGSGNERAQLELDAAAGIQGRAKSAFSGSHLAMAARFTLEARGHADRSIAIIRGLPDPDRVIVQLERTGDVLERVRQRIEECDNDRAHALIRVATTMQERAENAAGAGRYLAALQLTMGARERAFRSLRLCHVEDNLRESAEQALRRTDDLIARARDIVANRPGGQARQALSQAVEIEGHATGQFQAEHYEASLRLTQVARATAHHAIRLSGGR